ncbi:hypothetical protein Tsubulata_030408 [Turnera subulata]|uniref:Uncharacterized protein n=1 Tax=Turnera subulata TaxID=218843 RepID=A0A9Q0JG58_9ROSI|nr:hypothetical protein Tsubulata_030408 [Turnera subulata]
MPASPSFPSSDGRGKWKRKKREPQIPRKPQPRHDDPPAADDDDDDDPAAEDDNPHPHQSNDPENSEDPNHNPDPDPREAEVLIDGGLRLCDFPAVTRLAVNRPHASVLSIVAAERANSAGVSGPRSQQPVPNLENVSYGQMLAVSAVPAEALGTDPDRTDGGNPAFVVTPPPIMDGKGVVKRFGNRVHALPMHSGLTFFFPSFSFSFICSL